MPSPQTVAERLRAALPADVRVATRQEITNREQWHWVATTSVGTVFGLGVLARSARGFVETRPSAGDRLQPDSPTIALTAISRCHRPYKEKRGGTLAERVLPEPTRGIVVHHRVGFAAKSKASAARTRLEARPSWGMRSGLER